MGEEISTAHFSTQEFKEFARRLEQETELLQEILYSGGFDNRNMACGFELEAWLIDASLQAAPVNIKFLELAQHPALAPELARFNFEINGSTHALNGCALSHSQVQLESIWEHCEKVASQLNARPVLCGILPTLTLNNVSLQNLSDSARYAALNNQILRQRKGKPLKVEISGVEHLNIEHSDIMLEAASTSFQLHMQVPVDEAIHYYNAALAISAPLIAIAANSPLLFGRRLFAETRVPLFEQAVEVGGYAGVAAGPLRRAGFGSGYLKRSVFEAFAENQQHFPPLLPTLFESSPAELKHLRFHNGTIWRWNRPLIDFIGNRPHIRIEHRILPSGPTITDMFANAALFYGMVHALAQQQNEPVTNVPFADIKNNFYTTAQHGMNANIHWGNSKHTPVRKLLNDTLLPLAREGLRDMGIIQADIDYFLGIINGRLETGQTGADWQASFLEKTANDRVLLLDAMLTNQELGQPVHQWALPS